MNIHDGVLEKIYFFRNANDIFFVKTVIISARFNILIFISLQNSFIIVIFFYKLSLYQLKMNKSKPLLAWNIPQNIEKIFSGILIG